MFIKLQVMDGTVLRFAVASLISYHTKEDGSTVMITSNCNTINGEHYIVKESPEQILALIEAEKRKALRDEFAGCVVVGIMRTCDEIHRTIVSRDYIAMESYRMADAMIRAREG